MTTKLIILKKEKARLLLLAKKKREASIRIRKAMEEEAKLKKDIAKLRAEVENNLKNQIKRVALVITSKKAKAKARKITCALKEGFKGFQKFCDKYGGL